MPKLNLEAIHLTAGSHAPNGEFCVMELHNHVLERSWSDQAGPGESLVIAALLRVVNDRCSDIDFSQSAGEEIEASLRAVEDELRNG